MYKSKASYNFINLTIITILSLMMLAFMSYASVSYERIISDTSVACDNSSLSYYVSCSNDSEPSHGESYELLEHPLAASFNLTNSNRIPSIQSITKLSKVVSSIISILTHVDIITHDQLTDYDMADFLSICHIPSVYYIFALNRMRD